MYTEEKNEFPIKDLLLKILFLAIFVFLLMWLFPFGRNKVELKPLTDRIFVENINNMKEAAKAYYTNERLPKKLNEKVSMSLQDMYNKKLLIPFVDNRGKACDARSSYVEVTRMENEFTLKVYLSCEKEADYIIEVIGCNDKCKIIEEKVVNNIPKIPKKPTTVTEYEYKKTISNSLWSDYSVWSDEYKNETDSLKRKEKTVFMGYKWVDSTTPVYSYRHERNVYSNWSNFSSWTTTPHYTSDTKLVETRYQVVETWSDWSSWTLTPHYTSDTKLVEYKPEGEIRHLDTWSNWADWQTIRVNINQFPANTIMEEIKPASVSYGEWKYDSIVTRAFPDTDTVRYILIGYNLFEKQFRTKTTTPEMYRYRTRDFLSPYNAYYRYKTKTTTTTNTLEYRFRTRISTTQTEWFSTQSVSGWKYTGISNISYQGSYQYTSWLDSLPSGYSLYSTKIMYSYSTRTTTLKDEYTWSTNASLDGWLRTDKTRTKTVTM